LKSRSYILFPGPALWRLGTSDAGGVTLADVAVGVDAEPAVIVAAVAGALKSKGYRGEGIVLAIPSSMCLCASARIDGLPAKHRRRAMVYRLEEKLPIAAEEVVADFIPASATESETLGVCSRRASLAPIVEALEESGLAITAICPASLLALQSLQTRGSLGSPESADAVIWPDESGDQLELFVLRGGRLHGWYVFPNRPKDLLLYLGMALPPQSPDEAASKSLAALGVDAGVLTLLSARPDLRIREIEASTPSVAAATLAGSILDGKLIPWIDLRRDALAVRDSLRQVRTPLTCAAAAVVLCMLCLCGAMLWRANRYESMANRFADEQQAAFRQAFPTGAAPADVRSRLEAEERRLRGLSGDDSAPPPAEAGLVTLRDLITHLPGDRDVRYRVLEVRLDQGRFALEGQATAHGDADSIAAALKRGGAFVVEPPRTEQLMSAAGSDDKASGGGGKGVAFTITGAAITGLPVARGGAK
jgi:hypothetical protein